MFGTCWASSGVGLRPANVRIVPCCSGPVGPVGPRRACPTKTLDLFRRRIPLSTKTHATSLVRLWISRIWESNLMALTNKELRFYDSNVLRLPVDKRKEYHAQVDRLVTELSSRLKDNDEIKITRVIKSGSFAKYTILRKTPTDPLDVDVVFYISGRKISEETLQGLNDTIHALLLGNYPNKKVEDFEIQRKATTVTFIGSGISVDVVPVIADESRDGYGWQFDLNDGEVIESCAPCQIKFVRDRKNVDRDYRTLVRLAKKWRNYYEVDPLKSFHIELILAFILDQGGSSGSVEQRFRRFLLYIAETGLQQTVSFPENPLPLGTFDDPVVILDPICSTNNVAARITEDERLEILKAAEESWETANFASVENDHKEWRSLFGPGFKTEEE